MHQTLRVAPELDEIPRTITADISLGVSSIQDHHEIAELSLQRKKPSEISRPVSQLREHQDNFLIDDRECSSMLKDPSQPPTFNNSLMQTLE